jgi:hypothetical protein
MPNGHRRGSQANFAKLPDLLAHKTAASHMGPSLGSIGMGEAYEATSAT